MPGGFFVCIWNPFRMTREDGLIVRLSLACCSAGLPWRGHTGRGGRLSCRERLNFEPGL